MITEANENLQILKEFDTEREKEVVSLKTYGMQPYTSPMNFQKYVFKFTVFKRTQSLKERDGVGELSILTNEKRGMDVVA